MASAPPPRLAGWARERGAAEHQQADAAARRHAAADGRSGGVPQLQRYSRHRTG